ncbi:MAG: beta-ketoacyl synthase N-terminal-like domain-containing protein [Brevinematales bacterium]
MKNIYISGRAVILPGALCPDPSDYLQELPARFGRFDLYTKTCFSAAVLALSCAGMLGRKGNESTGITVGSRTGVFDNDRSFFETTLEENGSFASPNLFSYTLPNVALGEIAVYFQFKGPSFCVGNDPDNPGREALNTSICLLESGLCKNVLTGWSEISMGAAFAVLSMDDGSGKKELLTGDNLWQSY